MTLGPSRERLQAALGEAVERLLATRNEQGFWEGRLSSSAVATATAVSALSVAGQEEDRPLVEGGVAWLLRTQNQDGGWGDTPDSPSNLATTLLAVSGLRLAEGLTRGKLAGKEQATARAEAYLTAVAGGTEQERIAALQAAYGEDRTFAVPILLNCALAGLVSWRALPGLPFELAVLPGSWYRFLRLPVVSYALPALIAVGLVIHQRNPSGNPLVRLVRGPVVGRVLRRLAGLQPESGGFLEATPLTAFVAMSLAAYGRRAGSLLPRCLSFLRASVREDGSWPIDSNLSIWVTAGALRALEACGHLPEEETERTRRWLEQRQYRRVHPFTSAAPGGWGWTHLPGAVPDADDTAGALLCLAQTGRTETVRAGVGWLLALQNADGGWPTFCRGWGRLPFDRSCPDLTAHAVRALLASRLRVPGLGRRIERALERGFAYLARNQREDGAWVPLWFGNQHAPRQENPVLGTARVLLAYAASQPDASEALRGVEFLAHAQNADGGWGGANSVVSSVEETAQAVVALAHWRQQQRVEEAVGRGAEYLVGRVEDGTWLRPAPIGLYFARLWYAEEMYPLSWTVAALARAAQTEPFGRASVYLA